MSGNEIEKSIANVAFSMEAEGFTITEHQKNDWRNMLEGKITMEALLEAYAEKARRYGELRDA